MAIVKMGVQQGDKTCWLKDETKEAGDRLNPDAAPELLTACQKSLAFAESAVEAATIENPEVMKHALENHPLLVELRRVIAKATGQK